MESPQEEDEKVLLQLPVDFSLCSNVLTNGFWVQVPTYINVCVSLRNVQHTQNRRKRVTPTASRLQPMFKCFDRWLLGSSPHVYQCLCLFKECPTYPE